MTRKTGTREWSEHSANCLIGCSHDCRYCYARWDACERYKRVPREEWKHPRVNERAMANARPIRSGRIMFPTTHDILPEFYEECARFLWDITRERPPDVLVVTKPHMECVRRLCRLFEHMEYAIEWRFTISTFDGNLLSYWEPGAPDLYERLDCVMFAKAAGFCVSISMEPMLDTPGAEIGYFTRRGVDSIWIGKMNHVRSRVRIETAEDEEMVGRIEAGQTDERIMEIVEALKDNPRVRWKDSIRDVIERASRRGAETRRTEG